MREFIQSAQFSKWREGLRDPLARALLAAKLFRLARDMSVDSRHLNADLYELRLHVGPGYRVYYALHRYAIIVLLCGGDKRSQARDILLAKQLVRQWRSEHG